MSILGIFGSNLKRNLGTKCSRYYSVTMLFKTKCINFSLRKVLYLKYANLCSNQCHMSVVKRKNSSYSLHASCYSNRLSLCLPSEHLHCRHSSKTSTFCVTLDNISSGTNKHRVQHQLLTEKDKMVQIRKHLKPDHTYKKAAVLVPLCVIDDAPSLLFMVRSSHLAIHAGQVCFPGGKMDKSDPDLVHTALRETQEEIGLSSKVPDIWGQLPPVPSSDVSTLVTPVIGNCGQINMSQLVLDKNEVEHVFHRTIASLCDPKNIGTTRFKTGRGYTLPVYLGGEFRIWGLTAIFVHQALTVIAPGLYTYKIQHRH